MDHLIEVSKYYKGISIRAARYFFIATELIKLNSMYLFTDGWFFGFFAKLLNNSKTSIFLDENITKPKKIKRLQLEFTRTFYTQVCQCMFE